MVGMGKTLLNSHERYSCFEELKKCEVEGSDFLLICRRGRSGIAVFAPHGGGIEPGTTEIADAIAGEEHAYYSFIGLKSHGNWDLHLTSTRFDEPLAIEMARSSRTIVAVHGRKGTEKGVYIGGRDNVLKERILAALRDAGFHVFKDDRFPGASPHNLCNRTPLGRGVQLEITTGLRRLMFHGLSSPERQKRTPIFASFVLTLRAALEDVACTSRERHLS
jgi:phage replication-related protein YjqB (UPF0714/DUF867 family)